MSIGNKRQNDRESHSFLFQLHCLHEITEVDINRILLFEKTNNITTVSNIRCESAKSKILRCYTSCPRPMKSLKWVSEPWVLAYGIMANFFDRGRGKQTALPSLAILYSAEKDSNSLMDDA